MVLPPAFCHCCEPEAALAPVAIFNRPGLASIDLRIGRYSTFRQSMLEAIAHEPVLSALTTRDDTDYAVTLIDLFAAVADVLSFYNERIGNEMFLRTATERDSVLRLLRLIGYRLGPGLAASAVLAFTLDDGARLPIRRGLKVMSVPGQDERPQTFETLEQINADARLNALPAFGAPQPLAPFADGRLRIPILKRPERLLRGDRIVIVGGNQMEIRDVRDIEAKPDGEHLHLTGAIGIAATDIVGFKLLRSLNFFGHNAPESYPFYNADPTVPPAKRWVTRKAGTDYKLDFPAGSGRYPLEAKIADLKTGALLLVDRGATAPAPRFVFAVVEAVDEGPATAGPLADTVTFIGLQPVAPAVASDLLAILGSGMASIPDRRLTRIYELATPAVVPRRYDYPSSLTGSTVFVRLNHLIDAKLIQKRHRIVISDGPTRHLATVTSATLLSAGPDGVTHLQIGFAPALGQALARPVINANVARAGHGEMQPDEPLGHGDAAASFQSFMLRRNPLTYRSSGVGIERRADLTIRVNGEEWDEARSLFGRGPTEQIYTLRQDGDGTTIVGFGDGRTGARLPSGALNVVARYRTGLGVAGRVAADQLSTLLERPVGLRAVTNPLPADGGADPETLDDARELAPATVRTFGRVIALTDFEDVARMTGIVTRARATWAWIGLERAIHLTVVGPEGARLSADAMAILHGALAGARDPNHPLILGNLWRVPLVVAARILRNPRYEADDVATAARANLLAFFAFAAMPLGRAVHLSQIMAVLQSAVGVEAVDVDLFQLKGYATWTPAELDRRSATTAPVQPHIRMFDARPRPVSAALDPLALAALSLDPESHVLPAEQAFIETAATDITLTVVEAL